MEGTLADEHRSIDGSNPAADGVLKLLLAAAVSLPALIFRVASYQGDVVAVLYREPKKDAIAIFCWIVVVAFLCTKARGSDPRRIWRLIADPSVIALSLLLTYLGLTRLWVTIPANWGYEMAQFTLLFLFLLVLLTWTTIDPTLPIIVEGALVSSIGVVAVIGVVQGLWPGMAPPPIDPFGEVRNPSLMGYKNPAALSILAQLFLLAGLAFRSRWGGALGRGLLFGLLAIELYYLTSLQSRTAYLSLLVGAAVLAGLWPRSKGRSWWRPVLVLLAVGLVVASGLVLNPGAMDKAESVLHHLADPRVYLDSDRGTYLLNTLNMVNHNPFGVGLGDWQTMYPVYRRVDRATSFDERFQVRRAHSDHVQMLGEGGWPGLILWWVFLGALISRSAIIAVRSKDRRAAFLTAQLVAIAVAMTTDYFSEIPYNKFQFFLVVFLVIAHDRHTLSSPKTNAVLPRGPWVLITGLMMVALLGGVASALDTEKKLIASATSTALVRQATRPAVEPAVSTALLEDATRIGNMWRSRSGHWKSLFRDHLALAHAEALLGRPRRAGRRALESLRLQPFNPQALRLMAEVSDDPVEAGLWLEAFEHIETSTGEGFQIRYPIGEEHGDVAN